MIFIVASNVTIGAVGDECDMFSAGPARQCAFGLVCFKCPDYWNSKFLSAKCVAPKSLTTSSSSTEEACPSSYECGYQATCKMISGVPTCTCPGGYNLESNLKDCYGWKVLKTTPCSVTCGNGIQTQNRTCDRTSTSTAVCDGSTSNSIPCMSDPCPVPNSMVPALAFLQIKTEIITVDIFEQQLESKIKSVMVKALNKKCIEDQNVFENQCCVGKRWKEGMTNNDCVHPTNGVEFVNKYHSKTTFDWYVKAQGDGGSVCCKDAADLPPSRKRRATSDGSMDSSVLASTFGEPANMQDTTDVIRQVDSSASLQEPTVATSSDNGVVSVITSTQSNKNSGGLEPWVIGLIAGLSALVVIVAVIVIVIVMQKKKLKGKKKNKIHSADLHHQQHHQEPQQMYGGGGYNPMMQQQHQQQQMMDPQMQQMMMMQQQQQMAANPGGHTYPPYFGQYPPSAGGNQLSANTQQGQMGVVRPQQAYGF